MKLIDADVAMKGVRDRCLGTTSVIVVENRIIDMLNRMPTVDAIPVEWIKKYTKANRLYQSDDFDFYISDMIADWVERKEE